MEEENGVEKNPAALSCHHCQVFVSVVVCCLEDVTFFASASFHLLFDFCLLSETVQYESQVGKARRRKV